MTPICVMTIAGSDSGGGAGIQGDLKTFSALGAFGTSVITAITSQNTVGIRSIQGIEPNVVGDQISAVFDDFPIVGVKTGMLYSEDIAKSVVEQIKKYKPDHLVIDPVMVSTSGSRLMLESAIEYIKNDLFPIAKLITPNLPEMMALLNRKIISEKDIQSACEDLYKEVRTPILAKGGHRQDQACDILYDGDSFHYFPLQKIDSKNTHGTGCALSSAIVVYLSKGDLLISAIQKAKEYVTKSIENAYPLGNGYGPLNHFWYFLS